MAGDCFSLRFTSSGLLWTEVESPRPVFPAARAVTVGMTSNRRGGPEQWKNVGPTRRPGVSWSAQSGRDQWRIESVTGGVTALVGTIVGAGTGSITREPCDDGH